MIYDIIHQSVLKGRKMIAVLVDPDKVSERHLDQLCLNATEASVDFFFVGGSLLTRGNISNTIRGIKKRSNIPVVIFPGGHQQIDNNADAILLLSLISGRNPEFLIGQHVLAAPRLKASEIEIIPTGYILIDGGKMTTVQYVSDTVPVPRDKPDIAAYTALAGQQLGMKIIFAEAGSGAKFPVPAEVIQAIKREVSIPVIAGGGIRTAEDALVIFKSGADLIVVGNHFEEHPELIKEIADTRAAFMH